MPIKITYTYHRYGAGPGVGGNAACSNHHVLPYYVLQYVGLLWVAYAKTNPSYQAGLDKLVTAATATNMSNAMTGPEGDYLVAEGVAAFQAFSGAFAWLGDNLFTGPAGIYRVADPSQRVEPEKPASFPSSRWQKLSALWEKVKSVHLPHTAGERRRVEVTDAQAKQIVDAAVAALQAAAPHATLVSDWSAVPNKDVQKSYRIHVGVMTQAQVDNERVNNPTFDWCRMDLAPASMVTGKYLRIIQVTGGAGAKVACITMSGAPTSEMAGALFAAQFRI